MINLLLGAPGGGKSYEAVVFHVLPALERGRKVVTNLSLNVSAFAAIDPSYEGLIELRSRTLADPSDYPSPLASLRPRPFNTRPFSHVEDYADEWRDAEGRGPLYVVDECHLSLPRVGTPVPVEEWFSMHRHYNVDVLLITQSSGKINTAIKDLVQVCIKVRKAIALGDEKSYIRKVFDGVNGGLVASTTRKYLPQYFPLYKSHTKGTALAEASADDVSPLLVKFNRVKNAVLLIGVAACVYAFWPTSKPPSKPVSVVRSAVPSPGSLQAEVIKPVYQAQAVPLAAPSDPEPFSGKLVHLTGWMRLGDQVIYSFAVSMGGQRIFDLRLSDLERAGYVFQPLGECVGLLRFKDRTFPVTCDAPALAAGTQAAPIVLDLDRRGIRESLEKSHATGLDG